MQKRTIITVLVAAVVIVLGGVLMLTSSPAQTGTSNGEIIPTSRLIAADSQTTGPADAPVTIVEFSDFQCPACGSQHPELQKLLSAYPTQVRFVYRHFPLPQHTYATPAAKASEAAGLQGKFWEMHDQLFSHQDKLKDEDIRGYAQSLGLDMNKFESDWQSQAVSDKVNADRLAGSGLDINSTPTSFINGKRFAGVMTFSQLKTQVESYLQK